MIKKEGKRKMIHNKMKQGIKDGVPIAIGYFSVSFTFGMLAAKSGISIFHAVLISLLNLTSAGQFCRHERNSCSGIFYGNGFDTACYQYKI